MKDSLMNPTELLRIIRFPLLVAPLAVAAFLALGSLSAQNPPKPVLSDEPPTMTAEERARSFLPGPAWDGKGAGNVTEADATAFSEFPLFWLGTEFGGYSLHSIHRSKYDVPNAHPEDLWMFVYGDCPKKPNEGCMLPVSVQIRP